MVETFDVVDECDDNSICFSSTNFLRHVFYSSRTSDVVFDGHDVIGDSLITRCHLLPSWARIGQSSPSLTDLEFSPEICQIEFSNTSKSELSTPDRQVFPIPKALHRSDRIEFHVLVMGITDPFDALSVEIIPRNTIDLVIDNAAQ